MKTLKVDNHELEKIYLKDESNETAGGWGGIAVAVSLALCPTTACTSACR